MYWSRNQSGLQFLLVIYTTLDILLGSPINPSFYFPLCNLKYLFLIFLSSDCYLLRHQPFLKRVPYNVAALLFSSISLNTVVS